MSVSLSPGGVFTHLRSHVKGREVMIPIEGDENHEKTRHLIQSHEFLFSSTRLTPCPPHLSLTAALFIPLCSLLAMVMREEAIH